MLYWVKEKQTAQKFWFSIDGLTHGKRSKGSRIQGLQPLFADGKIHIRRNHGILTNELLSFPMGINDDTIDALSMHLRYWQRTRSTEEIKREAAKDDPLTIDYVLGQIQNRGKEKGFPFDIDRVRKNSPFRR